MSIDKLNLNIIEEIKNTNQPTLRGEHGQGLAQERAVALAMPSRGQGTHGCSMPRISGAEQTPTVQSLDLPPATTRACLGTSAPVLLPGEIGKMGINHS